MLRIFKLIFKYLPLLFTAILFFSLGRMSKKPERIEVPVHKKVEIPVPPEKEKGLKKLSKSILYKEEKPQKQYTDTTGKAFPPESWIKSITYKKGNLTIYTEDTSGTKKMLSFKVNHSWELFNPPLKIYSRRIPYFGFLIGNEICYPFISQYEYHKTLLDPYVGFYGEYKRIFLGLEVHRERVILRIEKKF